MLVDMPSSSLYAAGPWILDTDMDQTKDGFNDLLMETLD